MGEEVPRLCVDLGRKNLLERIVKARVIKRTNYGLDQSTCGIIKNTSLTTATVESEYTHIHPAH